MASVSEPLEERLYFGRLSVLLVESSPLESEILAQVLSGFRVRLVMRMRNAIETLGHLRSEVADLLIVGNCAEEPDAFELIRRIRRASNEITRTAPIILLTGHTLQENVLRARDCGASFVIAKPISPLVLYQRVMWLARDNRPFISATNYVGPCRRFQKLGPPAGIEGRRHDDLSLEIGETAEPNMSQDEIDALLHSSGAAS